MKGLTDDRGAQITEDTDEINKEKEIMDEVSRRKTCKGECFSNCIKDL